MVKINSFEYKVIMTLRGLKPMERLTVIKKNPKSKVWGIMDINSQEVIFKSPLDKEIEGAIIESEN